MITPFMYLLSGYNDSLTYDSPVDLSTLGMSDKDIAVIRREAKLIARNLSDEIKTSLDETPNGELIVSENQYACGGVTTINAYTALLLERVRKAIKPFQQFHSRSDSVEVPDLTGEIILRIEGNPYFVYTFVNATLASNLPFNKRIAKIKDVLDMIRDNAAMSEGTAAYNEHDLHRLELHGHKSYWERMLYGDYVRYYGCVGPVENDLIRTIRNDLATLGYAGFVNPIKMYQDFSSSRVKRKVTLNVSDDVILFLDRIVRSGGG